MEKRIKVTHAFPGRFEHAEDALQRTLNKIGAERVMHVLPYWAPELRTITYLAFYWEE